MFLCYKIKIDFDVPNEMRQNYFVCLFFKKHPRSITNTIHEINLYEIFNKHGINRSSVTWPSLAIINFRQFKYRFLLNLLVAFYFSVQIQSCKGKGKQVSI